MTERKQLQSTLVFVPVSSLKFDPLPANLWKCLSAPQHLFGTDETKPSFFV